MFAFNDLKLHKKYILKNVDSVLRQMDQPVL